jgi:hypothetical protein
MAAKQPPRKKIPPDVEANLLTQSRRRCALCFQLNRDTTIKKGQIAHLDRRRANSIEDNLAFLCLEHHSDYDSIASQHKNYTIGEVKKARKALYRWVSGGMTSTRASIPKVRQETKQGKPRSNVGKRVATSATPKTSESRKVPGARPIGNRRPPSEAVPEGPEIIVDYAYAEDSNDHHDANRPFVLKNVSTAFSAYNLEVRPLATDHGTMAFDPPVIQCIEPLNTVNVFADLKDAGPLTNRRRLPDFLLRASKDTDVSELFATKTFSLVVQYQAADSTTFESEYELLFRPWKKETKIGRLKRRVVPRESPLSERTRAGAARELPQNRPKLTVAGYARREGKREGLHILNEGTPAYDVEIETISLGDGWTVRFDEISGPLERKAFAESWVSRENTGSVTLDPIWRGLNKAAPMQVIFPLVLTYKDFDGRYYRSVCELHRDVLKKSGFDVKFIRQEVIDAPKSFTPVLSYEGITAGGERTFAQRKYRLQVAAIRNAQLAVMNTAQNVTASIEYNHAGGSRLQVRNALWIEDELTSSLVNLSTNAVRHLIVLAQKEKRLLASFDSGLVERELEIGHWAVKVTITGDNIKPLVLEGGFTLLPDGGRLAYDRPALREVETAT